METYNKPLAEAGLDSYRCKGQYGWVMIGARSIDEAMSEAKRSSNTAMHNKLEKWNILNKQYEAI